MARRFDDFVKELFSIESTDGIVFRVEDSTFSESEKQLAMVCPDGSKIVRPIPLDFDIVDTSVAIGGPLGDYWVGPKDHIAKIRAEVLKMENAKSDLREMIDKGVQDGDIRRIRRDD